ncbi:hypothetical protein BD289DRAFT_442915 [Coniella lustricola]|uniref:Uncharacterized protein n=1 Tax=Coniella lustricola TaxID=2025994 RepID=A0A2T2ZXM1_9PEZI|nr:hypothetical protein BD289DRAFT_442915 [Coniella lustricola]
MLTTNRDLHSVFCSSPSTDLERAASHDTGKSSLEEREGASPPPTLTDRQHWNQHPRALNTKQGKKERKRYNPAQESGD